MTNVKVTLSAWAKAAFVGHTFHINTLRRWASEGRIHPAPIKVGKSWFVDPDAKYMG